MRALRSIAAGVLFLQVAYVVVAGVLLAVFLEDTSEIDHTDPPAAGAAFSLLAEVAVIGALFACALLLAAPGKFTRVPRWLARILFGVVVLVECATIVAALLNIGMQSFGPDEFLNVLMILLSGAAACVSVAEVFRGGSGPRGRRGPSSGSGRPAAGAE
ncbi:hypothetical protein ABT154_29405 [Streptomyces sp. NPDC001728]|uniref:hypothetical protein n=1 Tax=Streptomyces sp. NPDC001728 TaxID=3154396 RepID=UPI003319E24B